MPLDVKGQPHKGGGGERPFVFKLVVVTAVAAVAVLGVLSLSNTGASGGPDQPLAPRPVAVSVKDEPASKTVAQPEVRAPDRPRSEVITVLFTGMPPQMRDVSDSLFLRESLAHLHPSSKYTYRYVEVGQLEEASRVRDLACIEHPGKKIWLLRDRLPYEALLKHFPRSSSVLVFLHDEFCLLSKHRDPDDIGLGRPPIVEPQPTVEETMQLYKPTFPFFKQYYCRLQWDNFGTGNIHFMPLGPRHDFQRPDTAHIQPPSERRYLYVLAVSPTSEDRTEAYAYFSESTAVDPTKRVVFMADKWHKVQPESSDNKAMSAADFARLLRESTFVLCPRGHSSETFRLYEALESGAIPVLGPDNSYHREHLPPEFFDSPLLIGKSWKDMEKQMVALASNPKQLQKRWEEVQRWYRDFMQGVVRGMERVLEQREPDGYCDDVHKLR